jgi:acyl CoA:acetate/3-ketoacid CoA transferase
MEKFIALTAVAAFLIFAGTYAAGTYALAVRNGGLD